MSIEWDVKFSDSLLVCLAILAHNILKNKTLCVVSPRVNFSDSPQYTSSSPAHHARAGTRALVVHGLYAVAPAHLALGLAATFPGRHVLGNPRCARQHLPSGAGVSDRGEGSDMRVRWRPLRRCQPAAHFCCRR